MYSDLYKGLNLRPENLTAYVSRSVSFDGKVVIPRGMTRLPVQASSEVVEVDCNVPSIKKKKEKHQIVGSHVLPT